MKPQNNTRKKILIVEDVPTEQEFARKCAESKGLEVVLSGSFSSALAGLESKPDYVLTDLFFPGGTVDNSKYSNQILPLYQTFLDGMRAKQPKEVSPLLVTIRQLSELFGMSPEEYVERIVKPVNSSEVYNQCRGKLCGVSDYNRFESLKEFIGEMKSGKGIPYGFFLAEELANKNLPSAIVTSTNHHDVSFEPIRNKLSIKYFDGIENEHKQWGSALDYLLKEGEKK